MRIDHKRPLNELKIEPGPGTLASAIPEPARPAPVQPEQGIPALGAPEQAQKLDFSGIESLSRDPASNAAQDPELIKLIDEISTMTPISRQQLRINPEEIGEKISGLFIAIIDAFYAHRISERELQIFDCYIDAMMDYYVKNPDKMVTDRRPNEIDLCKKCKERVTLIRELKRVGYYGAGRIQ